MIKIGKKQLLEVVKEDSSGYHLSCEEGETVFLPGSLVKKNLAIGDMIEVFVFKGREDSVLATPNMPTAEVGDFACLKVKSVTPHGAFLDIGLPKDLIVPRKLQQFEMKEGEVHLVKILLDDETMKLYGSSKVGSYAEKDLKQLHKNMSVSLIPYHRTPLGYKVLINNKYLGVVFHNEIFTKVVLGKEYKGSIKTLHENGGIDALLQEIGLKGVQSHSQKILELLNKNNGRLDLWDKSAPEAIEQALSMSKSSFKKAIGILYKNREIVLGEGFIELVSKKEK